VWFDADGQRHARCAEARIVSLVPSITETLLALGLREQVVGRTGFCIHPRPLVDGITKVGGTKDVAIERIRALAPTHVIVNIDENEAPTVAALRDFVPNVVVTHPGAPEDNLALYALLGGIFDREHAADQLAARLRAELTACRTRTWPRETVLYLIWKDPWMTVAGNTYIARTLAEVGWIVTQPDGGERGTSRYPVIDLATEIERVGRVLLSSEPYMFREPHRDALRQSYPRAQIDLIDGEWTSWYGVRAIDGLAALRAQRDATIAASKYPPPEA
jgi:ABC-type Fe3+-hydroxamate transport system substrate-binding protein